jgi:hypothetical protein
VAIASKTAPLAQELLEAGAHVGVPGANAVAPFRERLIHTCQAQRAKRASAGA